MHTHLYDFDGTGLIDHDPWLEPHRDQLKQRHQYLLNLLNQIKQHLLSLDHISRGHTYFGLNTGDKDGQPGMWYREWAPEAIKVSLTGDFNNWQRFSHQLTKDDNGVWEIFLPDSEYRQSLTDGSKYKTTVLSYQGMKDRLPAYLTHIGHDPKTNDFFGVVRRQSDYIWQNAPPATPKSLRIYETHVGIAQEEGKVGSFDEFKTKVLPRIKDQGYNAIQLMAIQQHPYYASFGYQVSNLFSVSHYFGTADELKELIDTAHGLGLVVFLDLVHSHMVKNAKEGLNYFDGTEYQYFHDGPAGTHPSWDTKLFDYGKLEVLRLLLSNVRYWLEEFRFDGFRFDGVTSMLYKDHGLGAGFSSYDDYFGANVDADAVVYLQLANLLIHQIKPNAVTIAEDVSGMPGLARPIEEGGIGFDYRLAMGIPDHWIEWLKHRRDEDWPMADLFTILMNRRYHEKHVAYAESHDQALVGDKSIAFWLMDKDMYTDMHIDHQNPIIDRGIALHNLIRLITFALGGEAWLNFMGNEFGHPEWIDFPREGNNYSFHYASRQWSLADHPELRYQFLKNFDQALHQLDETYHVLTDKLIEKLADHEQDKLLFFRRGPLVFAFNFHSDQSQVGLRLGVPDDSDYQLVLCSDENKYGGQGRVTSNQVYSIQPIPHDHRNQSIQVYLPARTAIVLAPR